MANDISEHKNVALTTFRRNGEPKTVPVGIVRFGDDVAMTTGSETWKLKRLRNDTRVELQPCNGRGVVTEGSTKVTGHGRQATAAEFQEVLAIVKKKYGVQVSLMVLFGKLRKLMGKGPMSDAAIVITLARPDSDGGDATAAN